MDLQDIQTRADSFNRKRGWENFSASLVFIHLIEEISEIGRHILFDEGYKIPDIGHNAPSRDDLDREFAQAFLLFLQLVNKYGIKLEQAILRELKIMEQRFDPQKWQAQMENKQR